MANFDTRKHIKSLTAAGFTETQAEAVVYGWIDVLEGDASADIPIRAVYDTQGQIRRHVDAGFTQAQAEICVLGWVDAIESWAASRAC